MSNYRYFNDKESEGLDGEFLARLDRARHEAGVPFKITSGRRTSEQNEKVTGVAGSSHIKGLAVDLACSDSRTRYRIIRGLVMAGITRFGVYSKHIHADADSSKDQEVVWLGESH